MSVFSVPHPQMMLFSFAMNRMLPMQSRWLCSTVV